MNLVNKNEIKIIFFGTSDFAVPALEALIKEGYEIIAAITTPDEPVGRRKILTPPPVKIIAEKLGLKILQPKSLKNKEYLESLSPNLYVLNPTLGVVAAYGKIIPKEILELPKFGTINIHPSLLPKFRGPTPIQSTILNGDKETGVTIIKIDEEVDHGPILETRKWKIPACRQTGKIENEVTYQELHNQLADLGAELLIRVLPDYLGGKITPREQNNSLATFTKKFDYEDGRINWNKTAKEIDRQVRALNPEPGVWTTWNDKKVKILETAISNRSTSYEQGFIFKEGEDVFVGTNDGLVILKTIQLESKKTVSVKDFIRGNRDFVGSTLK